MNHWNNLMSHMADACIPLGFLALCIYTGGKAADVIIWVFS